MSDDASSSLPGKPRFKVVHGGPGLPHDWETERAVLACLLMDSSRLGEVQEHLQVEDFARPQHAEIFDLVRRVVEQHQVCDLTLLLDYAQRSGELETRYGGASYLMGLANAAPTPEFVVEYARRVHDHALRRRLALAAKGILDAIKEGPDETSALLDAAEKAIFDVSQGAGAQDWHQLSYVLDEQMAAIRERAETPGEVTGITTGFVDLDKMLAGLQRSDLIVLAARPAMGKTAFALNLALAAAMRANVGVGIFSLEMSRQQLATRLLTAQARVDAGKVRTGQLDPREDWPRLAEAADMLHRLPLFIDDTPGLTITTLRSKARRLKMECPSLGLLVVDYLQLMQGSGGPKESRENAISNISRGLKILAKDLQIPVIALSQLNRSLESRTDKRPMPSDLRESGAIEQDADIILFIYRDEIYNPESPDKGLAEIIIAKQRSGPTGKVKLAFLNQYTLFQNYAGPTGGDGGYY